MTSKSSWTRPTRGSGSGAASSKGTTSIRGSARPTWLSKRPGWPSPTPGSIRPPSISSSRRPSPPTTTSQASASSSRPSSGWARRRAGRPRPVQRLHLRPVRRRPVHPDRDVQEDPPRRRRGPIEQPRFLGQGPGHVGPLRRRRRGRHPRAGRGRRRPGRPLDPPVRGREFRLPSVDGEAEPQGQADVPNGFLRRGPLRPENGRPERLRQRRASACPRPSASVSKRTA